MYIIEDISKLSEIKIYGKPLHKNENDIKEYLAKVEKLSRFLKDESRYSVGDYIILIPCKNRLNIVSSINYSGAYYHLSEKGELIISKYISGIKKKVKNISL